MNFKIPKIKKLSLHRQTGAGISSPNRAWLTIVYVGFGLFALSIIFHIWLFISAGKTSATISSPAPSAQTIDNKELDAVLSEYASGQAERISQARIDSALKDPSK